MSRDYNLFITDILDAMAKIKLYTHGIASEEAFAMDSKTVDSVVRNLEMTKHERKIYEEG